MANKAVIFGLVVGGIASGPLAYAASTTFDAVANIHTGLTILTQSNLVFASIIPSATQADTVVISTSDSRTCGANLICSGTVSSAMFDVAGNAGASYAITLPGSVSLNSGGNSMTLDTFQSSVGTSSTLTGGGETFKVGATLHVGAAQAVGAYTGTFNVTVEYN